MLASYSALSSPVEHKLRHWPPGTDETHPCRIFCLAFFSLTSLKILHPIYNQR